MLWDTKHRLEHELKPISYTHYPFFSLLPHHPISFFLSFRFCALSVPNACTLSKGLGSERAWGPWRGGSSPFEQLSENVGEDDGAFAILHRPLEVKAVLSITVVEDQRVCIFIPAKQKGKYRGAIKVSLFCRGPQAAIASRESQLTST